MARKRNRRSTSRGRSTARRPQKQKKTDEAARIARHRRVNTILAEALERSGVDREKFLAEACGDDPGLRAEVDSMLAYETSADAFIEEPVIPREKEGELPEGGEIGPYRLVEALGRGGMGTVYLAERSEEFEQKVAIKLIKRGMDSDEILGRFRHERQILANLVHPNIARLHDGGTSTSGQPYFVMELVDGEPLHRYVKNRSLSLEARLALFLDVCRAVGFAHQNLVVHRDLKPGNILVTREGIPKLVDFGIAKLLGSAADAPETRLLRPFTREYASPEQLEGGSITTRTDVYSLGIILYELLTGQRPYRQQEGSTDALVTAAREQALTRPSQIVRRRAEAGERGDVTVPDVGRIPPDLDAIVLKALRYEEDLRYASVDPLISDLECYRAGLPVTARQGSTMYRATKFVRRNAGRLLLVLAALGLTTVLALAEVRRLELERQNRLSEGMSQFLVGMFQGANPRAPGAEGEAWSRVLEQARAEIERLEAEPLIQAAFLGSMGIVYRRAGIPDIAEELLSRSLAIRLEGLSGDHRLVATSRNNLAALRNSQGRYGEAEELLRKVLEVDLEQAAGKDHEGLASTLGNLGFTLREQGRFEEAVDLLRQALEMKERLAEAASADAGPEDAADRARKVEAARVNLGAGLQGLGDLDAAEELYREALDTLRALGAAAKHNPIVTLRRLGGLRRQRGDLESATWMLEECVQRSVEHYGENPHPNTAACQVERALLAWELGNLEAARKDLESARTLYEEVYDSEHPQRGALLYHLAGLDAEEGHRAGALEKAREALAILEARLPPEHRRVLEARALVDRLDHGL